MSSDLGQRNQEATERIDVVLLLEQVEIGVGFRNWEIRKKKKRCLKAGGHVGSQRHSGGESSHSNLFPLCLASVILVVSLLISGMTLLSLAASLWPFTMTGNTAKRARTVPA